MTAISDPLQTRLRECVRLAEQALGIAIPLPELRINLRGAAAGMAYPQTNVIRLNRVLLGENPKAFLDDVIPHELAHLIVHQHWGRRVRPHGAEWQFIMRDVFNLEPSRCHSFDIRRASPRPWHYRCGCPERSHHITTRMHNDIERGRARICLTCRQRLARA